MGKNFPRPTGELQGDDAAMPHRGTSTGFNGDRYGADTSQDATNAKGKIKQESDSCPAHQKQGHQNKGRTI